MKKLKFDKFDKIGISALILFIIGFGNMGKWRFVAGTGWMGFSFLIFWLGLGAIIGILIENMILEWLKEKQAKILANQQKAVEISN